MRHFILVTALTILSTEALSQDKSSIFDFLLFSPESQSAFMYWNKIQQQATPPILEDKHNDIVPVAIPTSLPNKRFSATVGDQINYSIIIQESDDALSWTTNEKEICRGTQCSIDTKRWKEGRYHIYLQIKNGDSFIDFKFILELLARNHSSIPRSLNVPLTRSIKPEETSYSKLLIGESVTGFTYLEDDTSKVKVRPGIRFGVNSSSSVRGSASSLTRLFKKEDIEIFTMNKTAIEFESRHITLKQGAIRVIASSKTSPWFIHLNDRIKIKAQGNDSLIQHKKDTSLITAIRSSLTIDLPLKSLDTLPMSLKNLLLRQKIESNNQGKVIQLTLFPGQSLRITPRSLFIRNIGQINMTRLIRKTSSAWLQNKNLPSNKLQTSPLLINQELNQGGNLNKGESHFKIGLIKRARLFFNRQISSQNNLGRAYQRLVESYLVRSKWQHSIEIIKKAESHKVHSLTLKYYLAVSEYYMKNIDGSRMIFQDIVWQTPKDSEFHKSATIFLREIRSHDWNIWASTIKFMNNNNVLHAPSSRELPNQIQHRASLGVIAKLGLRFSLLEEEKSSLQMVTQLNGDFWLNTGLSEIGQRSLETGFKALVKVDNKQYWVTPFLGNVSNGSYPGIDRFGIRIGLNSYDGGWLSQLQYSHSKNLDKDPNDDSFLDPLTGYLNSSEDRSRQIQELLLNSHISKNWKLGSKLMYQTFRYQSSQTEDGLITSLYPEYTKDLSSRLTLKARGTISISSLKDRSGSLFGLDSDVSYQLTAGTKVSTEVGFKQSQSSYEDHTFQKILFGFALTSNL